MARCRPPWRHSPSRATHRSVNLRPFRRLGSLLLDAPLLRHLFGSCVEAALAQGGVVDHPHAPAEAMRCACGEGARGTYDKEAAVTPSCNTPPLCPHMQHVAAWLLLPKGAAASVAPLGALAQPAGAAGDTSATPLPGATLWTFAAVRHNMAPQVRDGGPPVRVLHSRAAAPKVGLRQAQPQRDACTHHTAHNTHALGAAERGRHAATCSLL
jgi:hypothetical protein